LEAPTGKESAEWLFKKVKQVAKANKKITVSQFEHEFDQPSIIARLPGKTDDISECYHIRSSHFLEQQLIMQSSSARISTRQLVTLPRAARGLTTTVPVRSSSSKQ
jgi:hypothetical protein